MDLKSGFPYWPVSDGLIQAYPRLEADTDCDVAILGAGITGALVAHHVIDAGIDAVVLDRRDVGWGSTAASTSLIQYEIDVLLRDLSELRGAHAAARAYLACRDAIGRLEQLARGVGAGVGFERKKSLYLAVKRRDRKTLRAEADLRHSIGIQVDYLSEDDIAARFAFRRPAALLSHDAAQLDAYAFTHALVRDAVQRGLRVFDRTAVTDIDATDKGVTLSTADGCVVRARRLVFASGYETRDFLRQRVARLASTFALVSEPLRAIDGWGEGQCLIWEHARPYLYLRTTPDGRVIVGGEDEDFRNPAHRDRLLPRKTDALLERFRGLFPSMDIEMAFSWAGTFGETRDGLAYIGTHRDWPSSYFVLGYGGNGITYSLIGAEIIRDALLGLVHENADLFRFDR